MKIRLYSKKIIAIILLLAVVVSATALSVASTIRASAETAVTDKSPGGYDAYTSNVNDALGTNGSAPSTPKSGDVNFEFGKPTVKFDTKKYVDYSKADSKTILKLSQELAFDSEQEEYPLTGSPYTCVYIKESDYLRLTDSSITVTLFSGVPFIGSGIISDVYYLRRDMWAKSGEWYAFSLGYFNYNNLKLNSYNSSLPVIVKSTDIYFGITDEDNLTELKSTDAVTEEECTTYEHTANLSIDLKLKNSDLEYVKDNYNYEYFIDLWRANKSGASEQLLTRYVVYSNRTGLNGSRGDYVVGKKDFTYSKGVLQLSPEQILDEEKSSTSYAQTISQNGYEVLQSQDFIKETDNGLVVSNLASKAYLIFNNSTETPTLNLKIDTDDFDAQYRFSFGYLTKKKVTKTKYIGAFNTIKTTYDELEEDRVGCIWSDTVSVANILEEQDEAGTLEQNFSGSELQAANDILTDKSMQTVQLVMLEQIPNTPFAHKVKKTITLPVRNGVLSYDTICQALNVNTLKCLNSNVESVVTVNSEGEYELVYLSAGWIHAASVSGAALDSFLSINESYETFYNRQTGFNITRDQNGRIITGEANPNKAVITKGIYEYFLNEIKNKYPELEDYAGNEIYGYWGFFAIPQEYNLDAAWKDIFGTATQYKDVAHYFRHDVKLSNEAYKTLLNDYGHSYLSILFNGVVGGALGYDATYYMVYVDDAGYSAVSDNGNTDPDNDKGLIGNKTQPFIQKAGEIFSGTLNGVLDFINNNVVGNIPIILTIAIVVIAVIVLIKTGVFSKIFSGKNNNKRRKK